MKDNKMDSPFEDVAEAVQVLVDAIKDDPDFYYAYQANIAMAFKDEMYRSGLHSPNPDNPSILVTNEMLHTIANQAAKNFLDLLINQPKRSGVLNHKL